PWQGEAYALELRLVRRRNTGTLIQFAPAISSPFSSAAQLGFPHGSRAPRAWAGVAQYRHSTAVAACANLEAGGGGIFRSAEQGFALLSGCRRPQSVPRPSYPTAGCHLQLMHQTHRRCRRGKSNGQRADEHLSPALNVQDLWPYCTALRRNLPPRHAALNRARKADTPLPLLLTLASTAHKAAAHHR